MSKAKKTSSKMIFSFFLIVFGNFYAIFAYFEKSIDTPFLSLQERIYNIDGVVSTSFEQLKKKELRRHMWSMD